MGTYVYFNKNIIVIGELSENYRKPIRDLDMLLRRPIGDRIVPSETNWGLKCLVGDCHA